jgi:hypothetical protein
VAGGNLKRFAHYTHTRVSFTLDRYAHVLPGVQEKAAAKLEAIGFGR